MPLPNIIKIFQTIKLLSAQELGFEIYSGEITRKKKQKQELSFLHVALLLDLKNVPRNYHQILTYYGSYDLHKISASGDIST